MSRSSFNWWSKGSCKNKEGDDIQLSKVKERGADQKNRPKYKEQVDDKRAGSRYCINYLEVERAEDNKTSHVFRLGRLQSIIVLKTLSSQLINLF